MGFLDRHTTAINRAIAASSVGYYFRLEGSGHPKEKKGAKFFTEFRAGITTFFTMAYIIAVNSSILSQTGGTCVCKDKNDPSCINNEEYNLCMLVIQRDLVTATATISAISSFFMGLITNLPIALAPGMGINAYFAYQVVGFHGTGPVSYELALTAVFVEGLIFVALSLMGLRQWLAQVIPASIKVACGAGIGMFLTLTGLTYSAGIGAITGATDTPLALAGCKEEFKDSFGQCESHRLQNPTLWIGFMCGGILTAWLMMYKVKSSIIVGILVVSILSWPRDTGFTYFPNTPEGNSRYDFFRKVVMFHPIEKTLAVQDWDLSKAGTQFGLAIITFLYVDILDCTGTLYSMARFCNAIDPATGDFERSTMAYCTDAISISIGSLFGSSPVTAFVESGAGIAEGGCTGITAMTTGICFFISLFFAPIFASIPPWATGGALILVGCMMMKGTLGINWNYPGDAIPAFVTLAVMPFSYSIAYGLVAGILTYVCLNGGAWVLKKVSGGRIVPDDEDSREYWTYKTGGGTQAPWFIRAILKKRKEEAIELESTDKESLEAESIRIPDIDRHHHSKT